MREFLSAVDRFLAAEPAAPAPVDQVVADEQRIADHLAGAVEPVFDGGPSGDLAAAQDALRRALLVARQRVRREHDRPASGHGERTRNRRPGDGTAPVGRAGCGPGRRGDVHVVDGAGPAGRGHAVPDVHGVDGAAGERPHDRARPRLRRDGDRARERPAPAVVVAQPPEAARSRPDRPARGAGAAAHEPGAAHAGRALGDRDERGGVQSRPAEALGLRVLLRAPGRRPGHAVRRSVAFNGPPPAARIRSRQDNRDALFAASRSSPRSPSRSRGTSGRSRPGRRVPSASAPKRSTKTVWTAVATDSCGSPIGTGTWLTSSGTTGLANSATADSQWTADVAVKALYALAPPGAPSAVLMPIFATRRQTVAAADVPAWPRRRMRCSRAGRRSTTRTRPTARTSSRSRRTPRSPRTRGRRCSTSRTSSTA